MRLLRRSFTGLCRARFLLLRSRQEIIPVVSHNRPTPKGEDCFDSLLMLFINSSLVVLPTIGFEELPFPYVAANLSWLGIRGVVCVFEH